MTRYGAAWMLLAGGSVLLSPVAAGAGTILHYAFEGSAGTTAASITDVEGGTVGTVHGDARYVADDPGSGLTSLDFANTRISFAPILQLATLAGGGSLTLEVILKPRATTVQYVVGNCPPGEACQFALRFVSGDLEAIFSDGNPTHEAGVSTLLPRESEPDDQGRVDTGYTWYHVAVVRDAPAGEIRLYVDRRRVDARAFAHPLSDRQDAFAIGARADGMFPYDGQIAEIRISDDALAPESFLCHSVATCAPTPVSPATWGRLKLLHR